MMKKIICLALALFMIFSLSACGYEYKEDDFSLTITVNKTKVNVGETVEVTATLRNLSGKSHSIEYNSATSIEHFPIFLQVLPKGEDPNPITIGATSTIMKKDAAYEGSITWEAKESGEYYLDAGVFFDIIKNNNTRSNKDIEVKIKYEKINIIVQEQV